MKILAPAKINIGLNVTRRREDGYHDIETVFYEIPLYDEMEINVVPGEYGTCRLRLKGIEIEGLATDNLVVKAYDLLNSQYHLPSVDVELNKVIPTKAGLGGGSSDAAWMIKALNSLFNLNLSDDEMCGYAARLGADCAFFVLGKCCLASGKGDVLQPIDIDLAGHYLVLVKPDVDVSTKEAYRHITPAMPAVNLKDAVSQPVSRWSELLVNDFEPYAIGKHPVIGNIRQALLGAGACYAQMSGSGSAVFGLFDELPKQLPETLSNDDSLKIFTMKL